MAIEPGRELLHYRVVEKIGEGGMGVVWKAVDTTLDRSVAIKGLPELFAGEAERMARFDREAKLLASLNHPNIAGIYGIHEAAGTPFIAMELVPGEDLAQRLFRGALGRDEAMQIALQIAQALEAAHESGVIHRDLKPANVKLTPEGRVKVLDFGLAKALAQDPSSSDRNPSMSPTLTSAGTLAGMVLGTAAYMSPEQAKGKEVDRRADIWSFGAVLYEMLTGKRIFEGETVSETLAAVIMKEIDLGALPPNTPRKLRRLLERCLQRDPKSRLRDIGDARIAIQEAIASPDDVADEPRPAARPAWRTVFPWGVAVAALAVAAWIGLRPAAGPGPQPVQRFNMLIAEDQALSYSPLPAIAVSRDGQRIAYVGTSGSSEMLFLRLARQRDAVPLKGTEGADIPFFSPDGAWIGFEAGGKLKKVSVQGGPPATLCDAPRLRGASWGDDGTIVFAPDRSGGLMRVSEAGGTPESLTRTEASESLAAPSDRWPDFLPGGRTVIFTSTENNSDYEGAEIVALSLEDGTKKMLIKGGTFGRFVPPGMLVYARGDTIFAARFDPKRIEVRGPSVPVLEGVAGAVSWGSVQLAFSDNGTLLYLSGVGGDFSQERLVWIDGEGRVEPASAREHNYSSLALSPDGRYVALGIYSDGNEQIDLWLLELERDSLSRLTYHDRWDTRAKWTPDGEWLVFSSARDDIALNVYRKRANGTGEVERLTTSPNSQFPSSWSPDGSVMTFVEERPDTGRDIMLYRPGADPEVEVFLSTPFDEGLSRVSPDGRWVAYTSNASGALEIYVGPLSEGGEHVKVSTDGGEIAAWRPDGAALFYRSLTDKMMLVELTVDGHRLRPGVPRELFDYPAPPLSWEFVVAPDGRMLAYEDLSSGEEGALAPVVVVNWFAELEEKVPAVE